MMRHSQTTLSSRESLSGEEAKDQFPTQYSRKVQLAYDQPCPMNVDLLLLPTPFNQHYVASSCAASRQDSFI